MKVFPSNVLLHLVYAVPGFQILEYQLVHDVLHVTSVMSYTEEST